MQTKISRDWQFSPWQCTAFLPVTDMVGASSELGNTKKKTIQTPNNVIVAENLLYQDNIAAKTGIFGKHLWQILAVLNKSGVYHQLWVAEESSGGVLLNTIFSKVGPKCWGKKGITSGRRMEPIADYCSLKRLRDVAAFTSLQLLSRRKHWPPSRLTRPSTTRVRECVLGDAAEVDQWCGGDGLCAAENHNRHFSR